MIDLHISWRQISQWNYELLFFSIYKLHLTCFLAVFHYTFTFLIVCKWYSAIVLQSSQKLASLCKEMIFYHNIDMSKFFIYINTLKRAWSCFSALWGNV